jgi:hypothetical protein
MLATMTRHSKTIVLDLVTLGGATKIETIRGAQYLMGEYLKVVSAEFSTII